MRFRMHESFATRCQFHKFALGHNAAICDSDAECEETYPSEGEARSDASAADANHLRKHSDVLSRLFKFE